MREEMIALESSRGSRWFWLGGLSLILGLSAAAGAGAAPNTQSITGKLTPSSLPKSKGAPVGLSTDVASSNAGNPFSLPNPTTLAKVDFDKNVSYQQKGIPL